MNILTEYSVKGINVTWARFCFLLEQQAYEGPGFVNVTCCVIKIDCHAYCTGLAELLMFSVLGFERGLVMPGFPPRYTILVLSGSQASVIPSMPEAQSQSHIQAAQCLFHREREFLYY